MTQSGSMDPFSTFLNVNREVDTASSAEPGPTRADVLRTLLASQPDPVPLRELSRALGVRTIQVAVLVAGLDEDRLVTIGASADDDVVKLTEAGIAAANEVA
jgi:DNA-binding MarR family transcriptional regulator